MYKMVLMVTSLTVLAACGGGSSSSDESLAQERDATECLSFSAGNVNNSCDFAIVARTFSGSQTPVTVPANSSVRDPDANFGGSAGACRAPFTPVQVNGLEFDCQ